jgi:biotin carboxyl carrier protein
MRLQIEIDGQSRQVQIEAAESPGLWSVRVDSAIVEADARLLRPGVLSLLMGGRSHRVVLDGDSSDPALFLDGQRISYRVEDPRSLRSRRRHPGADGPAVLKASMPGRVVRVLVERGQEVAAHQPVVVIEAMKMQNELKSPREGRVADLRAVAGAAVASGETLAVIE